MDRKSIKSGREKYFNLLEDHLSILHPFYGCVIACSVPIFIAFQSGPNVVTSFRECTFGAFTLP